MRGGLGSLPGDKQCIHGWFHILPVLRAKRRDAQKMNPISQARALKTAQPRELCSPEKV